MNEPLTTDQELLRAFQTNRDEAAFAKLLERHGSMVLGVCRRVLGDIHLAEDAWQATFLLLVTRADAIKPPYSVGGWLYRVAHRTALRARAVRAKQQRGGNGEVEMDSFAVADHIPPSELGSVLDEEISRLPEKQRSALILFCVEGRSRKQVAVEMGIPLGTTSSLLTRAKDRLRARLARRGFAIGISSLGVLLSKSANATVPSAPAVSTMAAATSLAAGSAAAVVSPVVATLMKGARMMTLSKTRVATIVAAVAITAGGTGTFVYRGLGAGEQSLRGRAPNVSSTAAETAGTDRHAAAAPAPGVQAPDGAFGAIGPEGFGAMGLAPVARSEAPGKSFGGISPEGFGGMAADGHGRSQEGAPSTPRGGAGDRD